MTHHTGKTLNKKYPRKSQMIKQTFLAWLLSFLFPHKVRVFLPLYLCTSPNSGSTNQALQRCILSSALSSPFTPIYL